MQYATHLKMVYKCYREEAKTMTRKKKQYRKTHTYTLISTREQSFFSTKTFNA